MSAFPLALPTVTRGYAALRPLARAAGRKAAERAATALAAMVGHPVRVAAAPRSTPWAEAAGTVRLGLAFADLPEHAVVEVDARLAARVVDLLAGGGGDAPAGLSLTPVESAALELLLLVALDAAAGELPAPAPRLLRTAPAPVPGALAVELELAVGPVRGSLRLALPHALVAALASEPGTAPSPPSSGGEAIADVALPVSVRRGVAALSEPELAALAPGDVVLLEPCRDVLVLPGGLALLGTLAGGDFRVEECRLDEWAGTFPVPLAPEIGRVAISLGELARLEPGALLALPVLPEGEVVLRAGEQGVARGRLVDVDGASGFRVDALEPHP